MSTPVEVPKPRDPVKEAHAAFQLNSSPVLSPQGSPGRFFQLPSPIITKRTRTYSQAERAEASPLENGKVKYFSRHKGHGFITPDKGAPDIFLHISDIDGEYVPCQGDLVSYRLCSIPPKNERFQAVHVKITNFSPSAHERWDGPQMSVNYE